VGHGTIVTGRVWIHGRGHIDIGDGVRLDAAAAPIELHAGPGARIVIGDGACIEGGTSIEAVKSITIGAGARVGAFCKVLDTHFHDPTGDHAHRLAPVPVLIGAGARIGRRSVVLPGAVIAPAVIAPQGTVVRGVRRAPARRPS
jgi:acetyltransferase-like isoleucine patch superfamily enzyme